MSIAQWGVEILVRPVCPVGLGFCPFSKTVCPLFPSPANERTRIPIVRTETSLDGTVQDYARTMPATVRTKQGCERTKTSIVRTKPSLDRTMQDCARTKRSTARTSIVTALLRRQSCRPYPKVLEGQSVGVCSQNPLF